MGYGQGDTGYADRADDKDEDGFTSGEAVFGQGVSSHDGQQGSSPGTDNHVEDGVQQPSGEDTVLVGEHGSDIVP